jgi:hypothetical protein
LDIVPARLLTQNEINQGTQFNTLKKYQSIVPTRAIQKIPTYIKLISPGLIIGGFFTSLLPQALYIQWNISVGSNWYVEPPFFLDGANFRIGFLTVKYRINTTVYRYVIGGYNQGIPTNLSLYNNQELPSNVCFEWWTASGEVPDTGIVNDFLVKTSLVQNPTTGDDTERILVASGPYLRADFGFNLPVNLPIDNTIEAFLTN